MRELLVKTLHSEADEGIVHSYQYYILVDKMEVNGGFTCESYGVKIAAEDGTGDVAEIPNITVSASRIEELVDLLTRNSVTPTSLPDVVSDWL